jgi:hypothetical protein
LGFLLLGAPRFRSFCSPFCSPDIRSLDSDRRPGVILPTDRSDSPDALFDCRPETPSSPFGFDDLLGESLVAGDVATRRLRLDPFAPRIVPLQQALVTATPVRESV